MQNSNRTIAAIIFSYFFCAVSSPAQPQSCSEPSPEKIQQIVAFLERRSELSSRRVYKFQSSTEVSTTCYWRMTFAEEPARGLVTLFLSPDGQYAMPALLDLRRDPLEQELSRRKTIADVLAKSHGIAVGDSKGSTTIYEFVDLQCPFCKMLQSSIEQLRIQSNHVRLVIHQYPLSVHKWARPAAEIAACVADQDPKAFAVLEDYIFQHQEDMREDNAVNLLTSYTKSLSTIDISIFRSCIDTGKGVHMVDSDIQLGRQLRIVATPTLYIDGVETRGFVTPDQLRGLIAQSGSVHDAEN